MTEFVSAARGRWWVVGGVEATEWGLSYCWRHFHLNSCWAQRRWIQSSIPNNGPTDLNPCPFYRSSMRANLFKRTKWFALVAFLLFPKKSLTHWVISDPGKNKKKERNFQMRVSQAFIALRPVLKTSGKKHPTWTKVQGPVRWKPVPHEPNNWVWTPGPTAEGQNRLPRVASNPYIDGMVRTHLHSCAYIVRK